MTQFVARLVTDFGQSTSSLQVLPDRDNPNVFVFVLITDIGGILGDVAWSGTLSAFDLIVWQGEFIARVGNLHTCWNTLEVGSCRCIQVLRNLTLRSTKL